jgi:hypothetical protein
MKKATVEEVRPGRYVSDTFALTRTGYLRIPGGLLPEDARQRELYFTLAGMELDKKTILLRPVFLRNLDRAGMWVRKAVYSNEDAKSPSFNIKSLLAMLDVKLPSDTVDVQGKKLSDGVIEIKF